MNGKDRLDLRRENERMDDDCSRTNDMRTSDACVPPMEKEPPTPTPNI